MTQVINDAALIVQNTPQCLRDRRQWVCWRLESRDDGKPTKVPYDARTGKKASSADPATWTTFEQAVAIYGRRECYHGVGFVFAKDDPYCGIDLDDCRGVDGALAPWAQEIVSQLPSYCEISPSENGVKIFLMGTKPSFARSAVKNMDPAGGPGEMEIYHSGRYFTVTGNILPGSPTDVTDCQQQLDALCSRFWSKDTPQAATMPESQVQPQPTEMSVHRDDRVGRCLASMLQMKVADKNDGSHRLFAAACRCVEHDLSDSEAMLCVWAYGKLRPFAKPWSHGDILKRIGDAEERVTRGEATADESTLIKPAYRNVEAMIMESTGLRTPIISGILREGETMNLIAAPKMGKSWLAIDLALAVATGRPWLGLYETAKGNILLLDNELHRETSANRIPKVAAARGLDLSQYGRAVFVENMRGRLVDLIQMEPYFYAIEPGTFKLIILDAWYRLVPARTDENDNGTIAQLYNQLDKYAQHLKCSFVLIHHASKGSQSAKAITDVGSGAGAQSRATDTHLVLRPHQEDGVVVLDAVVRSWQPVSPMCLRWDFPVFNPAPDLDPAVLRQERPRRQRGAEKESGPSEPVKPKWDIASFVSTFITADGRQSDTIIGMAVDQGLSQAAAKRLLSQAIDSGRVHRWAYGANKPVKYSINTQPLIEVAKSPSSQI